MGPLTHAWKVSGKQAGLEGGAALASPGARRRVRVICEKSLYSGALSAYFSYSAIWGGARAAYRNAATPNLCTLPPTQPGEEEPSSSWPARI